MDAQISDLLALLQTIKQRERTGSGLTLEATQKIQEALQTACDTCRDVLYPPLALVPKQQPQEEEPAAQARKASSSSSSSSKAEK